MGTASCAGRSCHGSIEPLSRTSCTQNEYTLWLTQDKHQQAYQVLLEEAGRAIARRLEIPGGQAHEAPLCVGCHTNPAGPDLAERLRREQPYGVGCESCHGPASGWLDQHITPGWKKMTAAKKQAYGMTALADPQQLVRVCADCHVGAPPSQDRPVRDVNHDLIAAGHPRLAFEFSAFFANLPRHWKQRGDATDERRRWLLGQVASAEAALELLGYRATTKTAPWPEFAEYDCFACHHSLADQQWRQGPRRGGPRWGSWYFALPRALAEKLPALHLSGLERLKQVMEERTPARDRVMASLDQARGEIRALRDRPIGRETLALLVANRQLEREASWETCEQLFLATEALDATALRTRRDDLLRLRGHPSGWFSPRTGFNPDKFYEILRGR
jgi:hypothetical protein